ncbi:MAG TPA: hypothetical protein VFS44_06375 [Gemmatimonadaceae bacterium]|nr:hypothetical protein [Gemmatimonadaceae bacterium]
MSRTLTLALSLATLAAAARPAPGQGQVARKPDVRTASERAGLMLPMATTSDAAREHAVQGQRALDMGHQYDAYDHFREAVAADSTFAFGYLGVANSAISTDELRANIARAVHFAPKATREDQLQIGIAEKGLSNDVDGELALARELVRVAPDNPRSYLALATVQSQAGKETEARRSMRRAIALAPDFAPAYLQLGNSYLLTEPRDFARAEQAARKAAAIAPREFAPYDLLGDVDRATGKLADARVAYTRAATLDPTNGLEYQQRGHVNTFLGNYDAARADYDTAIRLGRGNEKATFAVWRALVPVYAGEPKAGIAELEQLVSSIDGMSIPDPDGTKIFALSEEAVIASHTGAFDAARSALDRRSALLRKQAAASGNEEFRRAQEADIAVFDGILAARKGDYAAATAKAKEAMRTVATNHNPRRDEPAQALMGYIALMQKHYDAALAHFAKADPNDIYVTYHRALALEGAGRTADAKKLFRQVANYNFSSATYAVVRRDAIERAR